MILRIVTSCALVLALTVVGPTAMAGAGADGPSAVGSISGTVTLQGSASPIAGVRVRVWSFAWGQPRVLVGHTLSAVDGTYAIGGLPAGSYIVGFADVDGVAPDLTTEYHSTFVADAPSFGLAKQLTLADGQDLTGIDESLQPASSISGTVTDEATATPTGRDPGPRVGLRLHRRHRIPRGQRHHGP